MSAKQGSGVVFSGELLALTDDCVLQMLMLEKGAQVCDSIHAPIC